MKDKIVFIGCGNMASAILGGLLRSGKEKDHLFVTSRNTQRCDSLTREFGVNASVNNAEVCKGASVVLLCVKPFQIEEICNEIKNSLDENTVVISIAAGITLEQLETWLPQGQSIVRAMPNTPCLVAEGMTAICMSERVRKDCTAVVKDIFECCGKCELIEEEKMGAVIGISGSAPAYIYMMIEAMADGAVQQGMAREKAYTFAAQTVLGSAKMVLETKQHPGELKDKVCSPGGTTIEAVNTLEKYGFRNAVIMAVNAAADKSRKM